MDKDYQELKPGEMKLEVSGDDFVQIPEAEPFKFHISEVKLIEGVKYGTTEPETKLVVNFQLDEEPKGCKGAKGQIFTGWFTPKINSKSNLGQLVVAVMGELVNVDPAVDFPGKPLRIMVGNKTNSEGVVRQFPKTFMKPSDDQEVVDLSDIESLFSNDTK